jgi:hypothetical protein
MTNIPEIESLKIAAGKRTYFLDLKQSREGLKFLKITESKRLDSGEYERYSIMIFEENFNQITEALRKLLHHFPSYEKIEEKSRMEQTKANFANAYKAWSDEEDFKLTKLFCLRKKPTEISKILQRNPGAITSRIDKLDLKGKYG